MNFITPEAEKGRQLFNQGEYYEAHEYFEAAWRLTQDPSREFYRALLQVSGGYYRLTQERPEAAKKFFTHALGWLDGFPSPFRGIDTAELKVQLQKMIKAINQNLKAKNILQQYPQTLPLKGNNSRS